MKALVTGSSGFLGRHFVRALTQRGYDVRRVDVANSEPWDARDYFRHATSHVDLAIHCAAVVGGRQTIEGSPLEGAVNLSLDAELFAWALRTRPGRVVYVSSSAVYPVARQRQRGLHTRLREDDVDLAEPEMPDALYGWSKLTGELLATHARQAGVPVTIVRPFSGYGADQDPAYPFPALVARALRREDPFVVWGDGQQVRDFVHVDDIVEATLAVADAGEPGPVNIGCGVPVSFRELAEIICHEVGYRPRIEPRPEMPSGVQWRVADITRLARFYRPRVSLLAGVRAALATSAVA